ncbi:hypothetical protein BDR07DRAFT_1450743 [Suillus spraguei]|nr:hypothetical protein BDR07DRAFT_1450743 [Suillus spraguei]
MQHQPVDSTAAGADDTMGAVDDDFQWETVPHDLRDNETFMLAVRDIVGSHVATVETAAEALVLSGYLGATPHSPTITISLLTLELYRCLHLHKPLLSIEAFTKVICDLYHWPYCRRYHTALADTFDIYLTIHRNIDAQVSKALGHDTKNWHVLNACPPCTYELKDEPELIYHHMIVFDGNNSLSCMASLGGRELDYIDVYASQSNALSSDDENLDPISCIPTGEDPGPSNMSQPTSACTDSWKAATADVKKKLWGIFEETGVFASACHHGLVLWIADMIRSGELFKYPLTIVSRALETLGPRLLLDMIALAQKFVDAEHHMCVDAFHGYTHSYACQDQNHPNVINGMGIEDLTTMECIFSSSNQLATDEDKYLDLGNMLYRNYIQAHQIIDAQQITVREAKTSLGISDNDIKTWSLEQSHYLATAGHEAEWDIHAIAYVELLQKLREQGKAAAENASTLFLNATPVNYKFVTPFRRWELADQQYLATLKYMSQLLRLFELHKLNIFQTGKYCYRMCTHIAKSLQTRCKSIQNAVKSYNTAALALDPPAPTLDWSKVSHYNFLEEFVLLRETCQDIRSKCWAEPAVHEVMKQSLCIERTHKEIHHCDVENRWLHTSIVDEERHFTQVISEAKSASDPLSGALKEFCQCRWHINTHLLARLQDLYSLDAFTGSSIPGVSKGTEY